MSWTDDATESIAPQRGIGAHCFGHYGAARPKAVLSAEDNGLPIFVV
jgi:hypothetical protein